VLSADVNAEVVDTGRLDVEVEDIREEGREFEVVSTPVFDVKRVRPVAVE